VPLEELRPDAFQPVDIEACGTTVTLSPGDVQDAEGRETVLPNGDLVFEARGTATTDLVRHDTGEMIDELDNSGGVVELISADSTEVTQWLYGPSILFPIPEFGPVDLAAFEEAGIPDLGYFKKGLVLFEVVVNPETGEFVSEDIDVDAKIHHLCDWFGDDDEADRKDRHGDRWKDHN